MMNDQVKLYMVLLGSKAPGRNVEQHDFFFGIAASLKELVPEMRTFWPDAGDSLHIDGWREVNNVDGFKIEVEKLSETDKEEPASIKRLFFINLGGYTSGRFEEQHYTVLSVQDDRMHALKTSMATEFFKSATIQSVRGANSHVDDKYGIDVDEFYRIEELLSEETKRKYRIQIEEDQDDTPEDELQLGYLKLNKL